MTKIHPSRTALASLAVFGILGAMAFAPPAYAAAPAAPAAVDQAIHARGLPEGETSSPVIVDAGERIAVSEADGSLTVAGAAAASRSKASNAVYTADRVDAHSVRFAAVLESRQTSPGSWDFGAGSELLVLPDGRVSVAGSDGAFIAGIDAPWAVDANGNDLETYYTVDGTTLTQHVEFTNETAFPVVADPTVHTSFGYWTVALNKTESAAAVGTVASCGALFARAPYPGSLVGVGCGVFAAFSAAELAGGKCLTVHVVGLAPVVATWWPTFPKC
jgi:hypothetical protein